MDVLLLSRFGRLGASSRIRFYQFLPLFAAEGIRVDVAPLLDDGYLQRQYQGKPPSLPRIGAAYLHRLRRLLGSRRYDLIWLEKELLPWIPAWGEACLRSMGIPYVVDYDDAVFHTYDLHPNRWVRRLLGRKIDAVMHHAALVTAGNHYLADRARRAGAPQVEVIPTVVDLERYSVRPARGRAAFTVGWIGSPHTARYLHGMREALAEFCRSADARLVVVGAPEFELKGVPVETRAWMEDREVADIQGFDVGIMPLADRPWEQGKCGYKLIQYMACGVPVVASPVGVNSTIVQPGVNGFLAGTPGEWVAALRELQRDRASADRMGEAGRRRVASEYSVQAVGPGLIAKFRELPRREHPLSSEQSRCAG